MMKSNGKLEGGALMRGIAILGLALLAAGSLPAADVAIGQLQLTNNNGYQTLKIATISPARAMAGAPRNGVQGLQWRNGS